MKTTNLTITNRILLAALCLASSAFGADEPKGGVINGVKGVKQEAVESVKKVEPPTVEPPAVTTPQGVNRVEGIKAAAPNAVKPVPPAPAGAVSTIRAVEGVRGIIAPKQKNLEAALLIKTESNGTPAVSGEGGKGTAAAAALLSGPQGVVPAAAAAKGDGRDALQQFEKLTAPGS